MEHDYRELETTLGLDHFEGRSFTGRSPYPSRPPRLSGTSRTRSRPSNGSSRSAAASAPVPPGRRGRRHGVASGTGPAPAALLRTP
ncbi:hypothetical protein ACFXP1_31555 [Streptomyces sp. NPDC059112]|uniref:hypothetical protein n=1 Tax=Streptomyces sp. NPDC059112 TaxID=3346730 RepID=UPI00367863A6